MKHFNCLSWFLTIGALTGAALFICRIQTADNASGIAVGAFGGISLLGVLGLIGWLQYLESVTAGELQKRMTNLETDLNNILETQKSIEHFSEKWRTSISQPDKTASSDEIVKRVSEEIVKDIQVWLKPIISPDKIGSK